MSGGSATGWFVVHQFKNGVESHHLENAAHGSLCANELKRAIVGFRESGEKPDASSIHERHVGDVDDDALAKIHQSTHVAAWMRVAASSKSPRIVTHGCRLLGHGPIPERVARRTRSERRTRGAEPR